MISSTAKALRMPSDAEGIRGELEADGVIPLRDGHRHEGIVGANHRCFDAIHLGESSLDTRSR